MALDKPCITCVAREVDDAVGPSRCSLRRIQVLRSRCHHTGAELRQVLNTRLELECGREVLSMALAERARSTEQRLGSAQHVLHELIVMNEPLIVAAFDGEERRFFLTWHLHTVLGLHGSVSVTFDARVKVTHPHDGVPILLNLMLAALAQCILWNARFQQSAFLVVYASDS